NARRARAKCNRGNAHGIILGAYRGADSRRTKNVANRQQPGNPAAPRAIDEVQRELNSRPRPSSALPPFHSARRRRLATFFVRLLSAPHPGESIKKRGLRGFS